MLCTGSRGWDNLDSIYDALDSIRRPFRIIVGNAKGADEQFWAAAAALLAPRLMFNAKWTVFGKSAGPRRNDLMLAWLLRAEGSKICLAAWDKKSPETAHMIDRAEKADVPVWRIN